MSAEQNKAIVHRIFEEVWHKGDLAVIDEIYDADYVFHGPPSTHVVLRGPEGYKQVVTLYRTAFPDAHFTIEEMVVEGDSIALRWTFRGTHKGDLMGISPTGKSITNLGITISHFANGKIVEERSIWDERHVYQELGATPPEPAGE